MPKMPYDESNWQLPPKDGLYDPQLERYKVLLISRLLGLYVQVYQDLDRVGILDVSRISGIIENVVVKKIKNLFIVLVSLLLAL